MSLLNSWGPCTDLMGRIAQDDVLLTSLDLQSRSYMADRTKLWMINARCRWEILASKRYLQALQKYLELAYCFNQSAYTGIYLWYYVLAIWKMDWWGGAPHLSSALSISHTNSSHICWVGGVWDLIHNLWINCGLKARAEWTVTHVKHRIYPGKHWICLIKSNLMFLTFYSLWLCVRALYVTWTHIFPFFMLLVLFCMLCYVLWYSHIVLYIVISAELV